MFSSPKPFDVDLKEEKERIAPLGLINDILGYADLKNVNGNLDRTISFAPDSLFNSFRTQRLKALLTAIVSGEPDKAKAILDVDPSLLLEKLEEKDSAIAPTGHKFNLKPYQAALAVDDTQMAEMIKPYFANKLQDEKEADRQFDDQCPAEGKRAEEIKKAEQEKWAPFFDQRKKLLDAIRDSNKQCDITSSGAPDYIATARKGSSVEKELCRFYELLDATLNDFITAGKRPFPPNLLLEFLQMYDNHKGYKEYFGDRCDDPRATSISVYRFNDYVDVDFYPLRDRGTPGFNFVICGGRPGEGEVMVASERNGWRCAFGDFVNQKITALQILRHNVATIDLDPKNRLA